MGDLKIGEYVRTEDGCIAKYLGKNNWNYHNFDDVIRYDVNDGVNYLPDDQWCEFERTMINHDYDIMNLIKPDDYVNGRKVFQVGYNFFDDFVCKMSESNYEDFIYPNEIENIVTKEMFESVMYKK